MWGWTRQGYLYPVPYHGGNAEGPVHPYPDFPNAGVNGADEKEAYARTGTLVWYTLLPFSGYREGRIPGEAAPFFPIAPEGLRFYDTHHLTGPARTLATERLFEDLKEALRTNRIPPFGPSR
ncbi:MAG TPA: hypothetical protein VIM58_06725 [Candidatus Methylacidiphilales bacterium]